MPIGCAVVCLWLIFLAECETLSFVDVARHIRVSTTSGNPGNLLEFKNPPGNPGNLLEFNGPPGNLCVR